MAVCFYGFPDLYTKSKLLIWGLISFCLEAVGVAHLASAGAESDDTSQNQKDQQWLKRELRTDEVEAFIKQKREGFLSLASGFQACEPRLSRRTRNQSLQNWQVVWVCSPAHWRDLLLRKCSPLKTVPLKVFPNEHWERKHASVARSSKYLGRCGCKGWLVSLLFIQSIHVATARRQGKRIFPEDLPPPWLL